MSCLVVVGYFQQQNGIFFEACEVDGIQLGEFCAIIPCVAVDAYFGNYGPVIRQMVNLTKEGASPAGELIGGGLSNINLMDMRQAKFAHR